MIHRTTILVILQLCAWCSLISRDFCVECFLANHVVEDLITSDVTEEIL